jgi:hypothetical protein
MRYKHGHTQKQNGKRKQSLTYNSWRAMNQRCYNEGHRWYHRYGKRGIEVCPEWRVGTKNAFLNFLKDMGERPCKELTLERDDPDGNYCKDNCRWADKSTQRINQGTPSPKDETPWIELEDL